MQELNVRREDVIDMNFSFEVIAIPTVIIISILLYLIFLMSGHMYGDYRVTFVLHAFNKTTSLFTVEPIG